MEITLETIYKKIVALERDVNTIKINLVDEPKLRDDYIMRIRNIDLEETIVIKDFGERYGLKFRPFPF